MTTTPLTKIERLFMKGCEYQDEHKAAYHREGLAVLGTLAKNLGLEPGNYSVRSNQGGPAVAGEIILHTTTFYAMVCNAVTKPGPTVLIRSCDGLKDYTGGKNCYTSPASIYDAKVFERELARNGIAVRPAAPAETMGM